MWTELATETKGELNVGKIDCTTETGKPICKEHGVKGYPTLIWFPPTTDTNKGNMCKYKSGRQLKTFKSYTVGGKWEGTECEPLPGSPDPVKSEEL